MQLTEEYLMQAEQLWTSVVRLETMLSGAPAGGGSMTAVRAGAGGGGH
jgi:hypothetical protein